jgi:hypothetical protein
VAFVSSVFFSPAVVLLDFFYRVFGRFKNAIKKIAESFLQPPKKHPHLLTYVTFFFNGMGVGVSAGRMGVGISGLASS